MIRVIAQFILAFSLSALLGLTFSDPEPVKNDGPIYISYPDHVPGAYTGGFGEQTCHSCHFSYDINDESGSLTVDGFDETYTPGEIYDITVTVENEELGIGGFQMTARFEDGTQAGRFEWDSERISETPGTNRDIQYIQHAESGTSPTSENKIKWSFRWEAPGKASGTVIFNVSANAGNDDFSDFGDRIYVQEIALKSNQ